MNTGKYLLGAGSERRGGGAGDGGVSAAPGQGRRRALGGHGGLGGQVLRQRGHLPGGARGRHDVACKHVARVQLRTAQDTLKFLNNNGLLRLAAIVWCVAPNIRQVKLRDMTSRDVT